VIGAGRSAWSPVTLAILFGWACLTVLAAAQGELANLGDRVRGEDAVYYYVYLPSLLLDHDLDLEDDLAAVWDHPVEAGHTVAGRVGDPFSIGPALLWSPFFLLAHVVSLTLKAVGADVPVDGAGPIYYLMVYLGNALYALGGVLLTGRFLLGRFAPAAAALSALVVLAATPVTFYLWSFSPMSHAVSLFAVALFLVAWQARGWGVVSGVAAGLTFLVRWQDVLVVLAPVIATLAAMIRSRREQDADSLGPGWREMIGFVVGFGLAPAAQLAAWAVLYGSLVTVPQGSGFIDLAHSHVLNVLFSTRHGLLSWHPVLAVALVGLGLRTRAARGSDPVEVSERALAAGALVVFALEVWLNGATRDWWAGWSFGNRRFVGVLPLLAVGIAEIVRRVRVRPAAFALAVAAAGLVVWNQLFLVQYRHGLIPRSGSPTLAEMTTDKLRLSSRLEARDAVLVADAAWQRRDGPALVDAGRRAAELAPPRWGAEALYGLGCLLTGRWSEAEGPLGRWIAESPDLFEPRWALAGARAARGDWGGAESALGGLEDPDAAHVKALLAARQRPLPDRRFVARVDSWLTSRVRLVDVR